VKAEAVKRLTQPAKFPSWQRTTHTWWRTGLGLSVIQLATVSAMVGISIWELEASLKYKLYIRLPCGDLLEEEAARHSYLQDASGKCIKACMHT
jgi:hypothetical protein